MNWMHWFNWDFDFWEGAGGGGGGSGIFGLRKYWYRFRRHKG